MCVYTYSISQIYIYIFFEKIEATKSKNSKKYIWDKLKRNIYIYVWDMLYVYTHNKYNYLFQKIKEKIDFQKISKIN